MNTTSAAFRATPIHICAAESAATQFGLTGTSAVYAATATDFEVHVTWTGEGRLFPADAQT